jgi:hypothetical protein
MHSGRRYPEAPPADGEAVPLGYPAGLREEIVALCKRPRERRRMLSTLVDHALHRVEKRGDDPLSLRRGSEGSDFIYLALVVRKGDRVGQLRSAISARHVLGSQMIPFLVPDDSAFGVVQAIFIANLCRHSRGTLQHLRMLLRKTLDFSGFDDRLDVGEEPMQLRWRSGPAAGMARWRSCSPPVRTIRQSPSSSASPPSAAHHRPRRQRPRADRLGVVGWRRLGKTGPVYIEPGSLFHVRGAGRERQARCNRVQRADVS